MSFNNMEDTPYEDELDRMRARRQKRRSQGDSRFTKQVPDEDFEYIDDIGAADNVRAAGGFMKQENSRARRSQSGTRRKRRKKHGGFLLLVLLAILLAGIFVYRKMATDNGFWTIAVFGVDSRNGNLGKGALSDVEMICSINRQTGEIRLVSVFRDSYLRIDEEGSYDKINEAYFLGGHEQAVKALETNLGLEVDDYATFNWTAVINAINVLGGVDLEITDKEFAYINSFITETVESTGIGSYHLEHSGMNHLDGVQAVAYARLRLMDTDFNRTERQRKVIGLAMEKAKQADAATLKTLIGAVFPQISTSIGVDDLLGVAKNAKKYYIGQTSGFPFSHTEMKIGKKSCVIPTTLESNVIQLHQFLYDDTQYRPSETVKSISARIAEESGLSDPGKDTESGKNIGAQGNTGEGQNPQPEQQAVTEQKPEPETSAAEENTTEPESLPEELSEAETAEMPESESSEPSEVSEPPETIAPYEPSNGPNGGTGNGSEDPKQPISSGNLPDGNITGPGAGSGNTNASEASLEAPGQNPITIPEDSGPGV